MNTEKERIEKYINKKQNKSTEQKREDPKQKEEERERETGWRTSRASSFENSIIYPISIYNSLQI
jgi:hypothetical protein